MATFRTSTADYALQTVAGKQKRILKQSALNRFNEGLLGLGDIGKKSESIDSIAAMFDLEGFTDFCKQIEPHLSVPVFLSQFLKWLMNQIKAETIDTQIDSGASMYGPLPYFVKFMGDGLLVLWDASAMTDTQRQNVIIVARSVCVEYKKTFVPSISSKVVDAPQRLRCGLARGTVYSVGDGNDYVGSCINMAARLQKLPGLSFAFNRRGIEWDDDVAFFTKSAVIRRIEVRGIGANELVGILKVEFDKLSDADKSVYRDPAQKRA